MAAENQTALLHDNQLITADEQQKPHRSTKTAVIATLVSIFVYTMCFTFLNYKTGHGMAITVIIPVIVVGWMFGMVPGILAGVLTLPANFFMAVVLGIPWWGRVFLGASGVSGTVGCILIGALVGRMSDLAIRINLEIFERKRAEDMLSHQRDRLDIQAKELQEKNTKVSEEIDQRKQAAEELNKTKENLESLITSSSDPIAVGDRNGHLIKTNKALLDMLGFTDEQVLGKPIYAFAVSECGVYTSTTGEAVSIDEGYLQEQSEHINRCLSEGIISGWNTYLVNREQKIIPIIANIAFLQNEQGETIHSFITMRDRTEQRRTEQGLVKSKQSAEAANQSKTAFLANMSHEIRTPMNGIIGFSEMLLDSNLTGEQKEYARTIKKSAAKLLALINDILDFSKIEADRIELEQVDFDIEMLTYDVCELIRPHIKGPDIELLCRIDDNLPSKVIGDPYRFKQVLTNLMDNAAKFTAKGEIELNLEVEEERNGEILIHAKIRDTGIGIPKEKLASIFDLFQQADTSATRKYGGTGLGLSICKRIAHLMDGDVWVESESGQGSIFNFTARFRQAEKKQNKRFVPIALAGKKVLIVDDNASNLEILTHVLRSAQMHVVACANAEDTIAAFQRALADNNPFDIGVFDIMMPGKSGYDVARSIRELDHGALPLLAFSSFIEEGVRKCREAGFSGFLPKPINRIKLLKMIERLLAEVSLTKQRTPEQEIVTQYSMREDAKHSISILLAEDNPVNQKLAVKLLTRAGYTVDVAHNGREAVDKFVAEPGKYSIIFMDMQMPELNGLEATRQIRARELQHTAEKSATRNTNQQTATIPIVAMTANVSKGDRQNCLDAGMSDYITKPIKREIVFAMLKKWVF